MAKLSKELAAEAIKGIEGEEVYVFSTKEHNELLDNYKKTTIEAELKSRIAKVYDDVDADFTTVTGLKKPDDQKTYKYWPEVAKQLKEKADTAAAEVEKLKTGGSPDLLKEIEALRKASLEKDNEWKAKLAKVETELTVKDIKNTLDASFHDLKLSNLPKPVLDTFIESAKNKLTQSAKIVNGEIVFMDANGEPRMNKETYKPYTASELMAMELEPIVEKGDQHKGGGSAKPGISKDKDGKIDVSLMVPIAVKTRVELTKFLIESGLPNNTEEFFAAYDKYSVNLPI